MKIETVIQKFKGSEIFFRCPICHTSFVLKDTGNFICQNGHCFDLSSKGYIHFLSNSDGNDGAQYSKELFQNRQTIFRDGFYQPVANAIQNLTTHFLPHSSQNILDIGCGEGYYASFLKEKSNATIYAMDYSKNAILAAEKVKSDVRFMVADLANIPVHNRAAGLLLNIFTPANYGEFERILCEDGVLIKAVPGSDYLRELRECISEKLLHKTYSNQKVVDHLATNTTIVKQETLHYTLPLTQEQAFSFYKMTPMTSQVALSSKDLESLTHITIHIELFVCYPRKR